MNELTRRYAFSVKPHHLETLASYTARLLAANFEDAAHQRHLAKLALAENPTATPEDSWANVMAAKSGRGTFHLHSANAPKITHRDGVACPKCRRQVAVRMACTFCTHGEVVFQHPHFTGNVCLTHHRWVGPSTHARQQATVDAETLKAERQFQKLRRRGRIDPPLYYGLRSILNPIAGGAGQVGTAADIALYPRIVGLAAILTGKGFCRRFFDPTRTFAEAFEILASAIRGPLGEHENLTRDVWLYLRPTFLSLRESLDSGAPYQPGLTHEFTVSQDIVDGFAAAQRPLEPFSRYLKASGDFNITGLNAFQVLVPVPLTTIQMTSPYKEVEALCRAGHRMDRQLLPLQRQTVLGQERCGVCAHTILLRGYNDLATTDPALGREFSPKNRPLTADQVFAGSSKTFWWRCDKGHDFEAKASNRSAAHSGCPICLHRHIIIGVNDAATLYPQLAREFHPDKNLNHSLDRLAPGTNVLLWWQCTEGHTYRASLGNRTRGAGCRYCARRASQRVTIAKARPDLAAEWHPNNLPLTPADVTIGSRMDIEWLCPNGHSYVQRPERRNAGYGCFICSGRKLLRGTNDAQTRYPEICSEWHPSMNCFKEACDVLPGGTALYWWKCKEGHITRQSVPHRVQSGGCTECAASQRVALHSA